MQDHGRGLKKPVWLIVRNGEILDAIFTTEEAARFLAADFDEVIPYTIEI
jgi:hypothetical protein